jgi:PAS domain S-box-containing protein
MTPRETPASAPTDQARPTDDRRNNDEYFRLMVEAVKDYGIFMLDPHGRISNWNEGAQRIKGYTADEVVGQHFSIFYPEEALAKGWPDEELRRATAHGRFEDEGWRLRKDGSRFWANVVITALRDEDGVLVGFTKVTRDLTERRRHEEQLRESEQRLALANAELERRNTDLEHFAYAASHDLQEPLRKIIAFGDLLVREYASLLPEEGRMFVERMQAAAQRMHRLIGDLLGFSRVTMGEQSFKPVDLQQLVAEVTADLQVLVDETGGRVEAGPLPVVQADPTQMRQLFQNLIGNGLKFRRRGVPPVVRVAAEADPAPDLCEGCRILVEDNGIGFEEKYARAIFTPFRRLNTDASYGGTGLGLSICLRIVQRHGGTLTAHSLPGEGTTFTIDLPACRVAVG